MKIAYITHIDADDVHAWSGLFFNIKKALAGQGHEVIPIKINERFVLLFKLKKFIYRYILGKNYLRDRSSLHLKLLAWQIEKKLAGVSHDVIFAPGSLYFAFLKQGSPAVFWTDATFAGMVGYYPSFTNLCDETLKDGNSAEEKGLNRSSLAIYSSLWAAQSAINYYGMAPDRVKVIPFGANMSETRNELNIKELVVMRLTGVLKLLFAGVDWIRKGGPMALAVVDELNRRGVRTELHIVGCSVPGTVPEYVVEHGFLSKKDPVHYRKLEELFSTSSFFILPSLAECYGVVFAEASSYGLPSLATDTGGVSTVVRAGLNGMTFPIDAAPSEYCDYVIKNMSRENYTALAFSTFNEFKKDLNWSVAGRAVAQLLGQVKAGGGQ